MFDRCISIVTHQLAARAAAAAGQPVDPEPERDFIICSLDVIAGAPLSSPFWFLSQQDFSWQRSLLSVTPCYFHNRAVSGKHSAFPISSFPLQPCNKYCMSVHNSLLQTARSAERVRHNSLSMDFIAPVAAVMSRDKRGKKLWGKNLAVQGCALHLQVTLQSRAFS